MMPKRLQRLDEAGFRALARRHSPFLDSALPRLSQAANKGLLWHAIAGALLATRNRRAHRAAGRGLLALAFTATVVNVPAKLLARRRRPPLESVPLPRRLQRAPVTSSFPSGHAASAAAFAMAASLEMPPLAAPLAPTAAFVGLSRVYVGAHYPSDVVVGATLGASIAIASHALRQSEPDSTSRREPKIAATVDIARGRGLALVVNPSAGSPLGQDPRATLEKAFPEAKFVDAMDGELDEALENAVSGGLAVLGVCGGDGTVNAAARVAADRGLPLLVVPGGTLNHFARDIAHSSVADAIEAGRSGGVTRIDLAFIDGRPFLNTASFGAYAEIVDERERLEGRIGKWPALVVALARVLFRSTSVNVDIDGTPRRLWAIFIGNCRYEPRGLAPSSRETLDDGSLDVRVLRAEGRWSRVGLLVAALSGDARRSSRYEEWTTSRLEVRSPGGVLRIACDGETFDGSPAFTIEKQDQALSVIVRRPDED